MPLPSGMTLESEQQSLRMIEPPVLGIGVLNSMLMNKQIQPAYWHYISMVCGSATGEDCHRLMVFCNDCLRYWQTPWDMSCLASNVCKFLEHCLLMWFMFSDTMTRSTLVAALRQVQGTCQTSASMQLIWYRQLELSTSRKSIGTVLLVQSATAAAGDHIVMHVPTQNCPSPMLLPWWNLNCSMRWFRELSRECEWL